MTPELPTGRFQLIHAMNVLLATHGSQALHYSEQGSKQQWHGFSPMDNSVDHQPDLLYNYAWNIAVRMVWWKEPLVGPQETFHLENVMIFTYGGKELAEITGSQPWLHHVGNFETWPCPGHVPLELNHYPWEGTQASVFFNALQVTPKCSPGWLQQD